MDKSFILSHVEDFTAQQMFEFICQGIVTLEELKNTGNLDASMRKEIMKLQIARDKEDDNAWFSMRYTEQGCRDYLEQYPTGKHVEEAQQQIDYLEQQRMAGERDREDILRKIRQDSNAFPPGMIRQYLNEGILERNDLINCGIPDAIINRLNDNVVPPILQLGDTPDSIPLGYTEVYFWGIPGSGKTCALSAVLSTAEKMGYLEIAQGPGYNYTVLLKNIFSHKISLLPAASPVDTTQYLPFTLKKPDEKYARSVSLIELSGEIFQCFLHKNANISLPTQQHEDTFDTLIRFLNGGNRKIHFFFVDYDKENNPDANGYTQSDYLNAAATFFNDKKNNLFSKTTDAMYVVLAKSDLMECGKHERVEQVSQYLQNNNFATFVNSLRNRCRENSINAKRILGTPFALGRVYFQHFCMFDDETSRNIIDILMRRIEPKKESILDFFNK
jgi:hypothetical protein